MREAAERGADIRRHTPAEAFDFAAQRIVPATELPVGAMTGVIGGAYLCWLLAYEWKAGRS